jgi:hypothetical protein
MDTQNRTGSTTDKPGRFPAIALAMLLGISLFPGPTGSMAKANEPPATTPSNPPAQGQPTVPTDSTNPPSPDATSKQPPPSKPIASDRDEERVNINEIYPEYCRAYFPFGRSVSLFEYREGMYRCFYGVDR